MAIESNRHLVVELTIPARTLRNPRYSGLQTEQYGSRNAAWDDHVRKHVREQLQVREKAETDFAFFEVESIWNAFPDLDYRRDLENFRLKPILDAITETGAVWPDDNLRYVRRIVRDLVMVKSTNAEQVVIRVYGKRRP